MSNSSTKNTLDKGHNFAVIGLIIALLALSLSVTGILVMDSPSKLEIQTDYFKITAILLALGAIFNGFLGILRKKQRYIGGTAILIALSAIIVQYLWITLTVLVVIILLMAVLASLGVEF